MNSKERVLTILDHKEPDRVPVGEWGIDYDIVQKVLGRETFWRAKAKTTRALWEGRRDEVVESFKKDIVELVVKLDHDLVPVHLVPPKGYEPPKVERIDEMTWKEESGRIWKYSAGNDALLPVGEPARFFDSKDQLREYFETKVVPRCGLRITGKTGDSYQLALDDESRLDLIRYVVEKLGDEKFIFARGFEEALGSPEPLFFSEFEAISLFFGIGMEDFLLAAAMNPVLAEEAFRLYSELALAMANVFIREGVDAIMPQGDFANAGGPMIAPEQIKRIFLPGMKKVCDYGHQERVKVFTHNCGNNWKILGLLLEAGYDCWQSIQIKTAEMELGRLKSEYGSRLSFWGGIALETLIEGSPKDVQEEVRESLRIGASGGGFILGTSNSVAFGSKYDNYMMAMETLHEYGRYPIKGGYPS
ncbi:MAG: hypothetical protein DRP87_07830 [Spirochaetes bacterium]|nr:MAG: hypothetical protein DRP87_07830 [Spirochaetota bacterium]